MGLRCSSAVRVPDKGSLVCDHDIFVGGAPGSREVEVQSVSLDDFLHLLCYRSYSDREAHGGKAAWFCLIFSCSACSTFAVSQGARSYLRAGFIGAIQSSRYSFWHLLSSRVRRHLNWLCRYVNHGQ